MRALREDMCTQLLERYNAEGEAFLQRILTGDESWFHHYCPECNAQSMEYRHKTSLSLKKFKKPPPKKRTLVTRSKDIDHARLSIDLSSKVQEIPIDSACDKVEAFNAIMTNIPDKHAPLETRAVTDKPAAPWMTATIKEAKAERRRAERTWRASKLTVHRNILSNVIAKLRT
ncbi:histone-lysine n-methyltransferase setmar-like protein [Elysia marginata]|uniref:Histone-lysine n-methyltransferase setmar-like protein n=1 Tax=Elysia marginata TaxID=1093978 RepID=A0AAV4I9M1_9GAST|nr:histone-lysine n-methyltransferase setmar-like protein [Elysia marginata]